MSDDEIAPWPLKIPKPQMTMRVGAPQDLVLDVLARSLDAHRYRTKDRTADGFRGLHFPWGYLLVLETAYRTELFVRASGGDVRISVGKHELASTPRRRASQGLNAAVQELRQRGLTVEWTEWTTPSP